MFPQALGLTFLQLVTTPITNSTSVTTAQFATGRPLLLTFAYVVVALAAIILVGTLFGRLVERLAKRAGAPKSVSSSVRQWVALLMILAAAAAVTGIAGISSTYTSLTLSGIGGLAVTLALQTTLSNIIAGVLMLRDGVLRLGDVIEFGSTKGEVVRLNMRTTWVRTGEGVIAIIGNSNLSAGPILNHTAGARLGKKLAV
ncbi:MAG: mechanosensitive ion channel family protein [Thaumarchaeota archaeon]|nr:mechanosensitive ion channel family protein [Nitrososphaerota archaeon]